MSTTPHPGVPAMDEPIPQIKKRPNRMLRIVVTLALIICTGGVLVRARELANRAKCASNLRSLGLAMMLYTNDHNGQYPDSFQSLLMDEQITGALFTCPSSNDEPAEGKDSAERASNLIKPNHLSYIYVAKGVTTATVKNDQLIAYEKTENHQQDGLNMLFGDGHVEWESMPNARAPISKAMATTRP